VPISNERIVWIDCEMTGLDTVNDALIEVAALVTDSELNILGDGVDVVIKPDDAALAQMNDFVRDMHTRSGLLKELPAGKTLAEAEEAVMAYIRKWVPDVRKAPLAGNSVGTDRVFLARDMPAVVEHLHYRVIDVSTIKELARRWFARAYFQSPAKLGGHRALGDIKDSIDELRYYREAVFVPAPGPDSATAQEISRRIADQPAVIEQLTQGVAGKHGASGGALPAESGPAS
jgi:oligoribonuclease